MYLVKKSWKALSSDVPWHWAGLQHLCRSLVWQISDVWFGFLASVRQVTFSARWQLFPAEKCIQHCSYYSGCAWCLMLQPIKKLNSDIDYFMVTSFSVQLRVWIMNGKSTMYSQPIINFKWPAEKCDPHFSWYYWIKLRCLIADRMPKMFSKNYSAFS